MDLFRNIISTFHKRSLLKPKKMTVLATIKHNEETNRLEPQSDKTNNIIQSNVDVEVKGTPEMNVFNNTKIVKETSQNNENFSNEKLHERKFDANIKESFNNNATDLRIKKLFLNNTGVSVVKAGGNLTNVNINNDQSTDVNVKNEIDSSCEKGLVDIVSENNNKITVNEKNTSKASTTDPKTAAIDKVNTNITHTIGGNSNDNSNIQNIKEENMKLLKEFDEVLAKVKRQDNAVNKYDAEAISLDDIEEVLSKRLQNIDTTQSFQEIKHYTITKDTKIDGSFNKTVENILETDSNKVENLIEINQRSEAKTHSKVTVEDNSDIISISSDDTTNLEDEDATNCKNSENVALKNENVSPTKIERVHNLKIGEIQNIETISISSEEVRSESEDDTGYHSSDFEFITEQEAKMDGLIIHYKSRQINTRVEHDSIPRSYGNRVLNDSHGPGTSTNEKSNHKRDENCTENYAVPQENKFLNMFHEIIPGIPNGEIRFLENKSVWTRTPMLVQYDGIGFDMNLAMRGVESSDEEYRDEAKETLNKILQMYPNENTRRKRRRRY